MTVMEKATVGESVPVSSKKILRFSCYFTALFPVILFTNLICARPVLRSVTTTTNNGVIDTPERYENYLFHPLRKGSHTKIIGEQLLIYYRRKNRIW